MQLTLVQSPCSQPTILMQLTYNGLAGIGHALTHVTSRHGDERVDADVHSRCVLSVHAVGGDRRCMAVTSTRGISCSKQWRQSPTHTNTYMYMYLQSLLQVYNM